jgi:multisubunit Na+/H+ antiporter MnhC subunit
MGRVHRHNPLRPLPPLVLHRRIVSPPIPPHTQKFQTNPRSSDYSAKVFGFATFGKVYGLIICLAGLLNFSQTALDAATHKTFHNNPIPVNMLLLGLALLVGIALVAFVWRRSHRIMRENIEDEAEEAREVLMPQTGVADYGALSPTQENRGRRM